MIYPWEFSHFVSLFCVLCAKDCASSTKRTMDKASGCLISVTRQESDTVLKHSQLKILIVWAAVGAEREDQVVVFGGGEAVKATAY